jgi:hypothetical protein
MGSLKGHRRKLILTKLTKIIKSKNLKEEKPKRVIILNLTC